MKWRLFRLGGTVVWLHPMTLLAALYLIALGYRGMLIAGFGSILIHEAAHALISTSFGYPPSDVELTPLGALMRLEDDNALHPVKRLLVLLAGPLATLLMCYAALWGTQAGWLGWETGRTLFLCNLSILLMNLLPALPLDGGRIVALGLSLWMRPERMAAVMRAIGTVLGTACIALNLYFSWSGGGWNLSLSLVGCFLMYSAAVSTTGAVMAELRAFMDRKNQLETSHAMPCRWVVLTEDATLRQAVRQMSPRKQTMFCLLRSGTLDCRAILGEQEVMAGYLDSPSCTVAELIERGRKKATFAD